MLIKIKKTISFLLITLLVCFPSLSYSQDITKGMHLLAARKLLFKAGWQPVSAPRDYTPIGVESLLIRAHILEIDSCAVDKAICQFNYKKQDKCLRVFATGEVVKDMLVSDFDRICAE